MNKIIGRFVPFGNPYRGARPFNVLTKVASDYLPPAWKGIREGGDEYHVIERAWRFEPVEWNGVGLPPVGFEFEYSSHANGFSSWNWRKCTAVGKHGVLCVDENDTELYLNDTNNKFRPAKTESDKKRDISVNEMVEVYRNALGCPSHAIGELYDAIAAGKIPGIRID
ncbi:MAG TPA: hypothetical protein VGN40_04030 [Lelliottia sp.]|jgi:hypothetical protein